MYKLDILGQYQRELLPTIVSDDPEIRQLVDSVYQRERQYLIDFYEEGKRQGYINPELSTEAIMPYYEIPRKGMATESILSKDSERNIKLTRELTLLHYYCILGKPAIVSTKRS